MSDLVPVSGRQLAAVGAGRGNVPTIFLRTEDAGRRFWEFFTANIRNRNTRTAYFVAVSQFSKWCERHKLTLEAVQPIHVAAYIEQLGSTRSKPTVKQHLAAIRMLFDWLVTGQVIPINPAHAVRGPRHSVKKGKTLGAVGRGDGHAAQLDSDQDTTATRCSSASAIARSSRSWATPSPASAPPSQ